MLWKHRTVSALILMTFNLLACWPVHSAWATADMLNDSWTAYKGRFIQGDGRVIDLKAEGVSTSEGQSYAMLRAVWVGDQQSFDRILEWSINNLINNARPDSLFAWKWGKRDNNSWGVLDSATASDADEDTAFALLLATDRWRDKKYEERAQTMLADLWNKETLESNGRRYLAAGDGEREGVLVRINPSYFSPLEYRFFAQRDESHNWQSLIDPGYDMVEKTSSVSPVKLPPNWAYLDPKSGVISVPDSLTSQLGDYSYDAIRVFWRVALDYRHTKDQRAYNYLSQHTEWLSRYWSIRKQWPAELTNDGVPRVDFETLEAYAAVLPAMEISKPGIAQQIYETKLQPNYHDGLWVRPNTDDAYRYYAQNIVWFGLAVYRDTLPLRVNLKNAS
ncbi:MAG TPA: glycosyl hydrolase family 8 [Blastocatellia bacterium]|nr:glycosyl hydrolase family 8 [Blastocatellia bacterium]